MEFLHNAYFTLRLDSIFFNRQQIVSFDNIYFFLFLFICLVFFYVTKKNKLVLLIEGLLFYSAFSLQLTIQVIVLAFINYLSGIIMYRFNSKILLSGIILLDVSFLVYYKYIQFILSNITHFFPEVDTSFLSYVIIPLGISFFTFEFIHYIVDIYRGKKPICNLTNFFLFIFFFPTLISGPIKRFEKFIPQIKWKKTRWDIITDGVFLIIKGLVKKIIIADSFALFVSQPFDGKSSTFLTLLAIYSFSIQIYFDFSGYTDIARGVAELFCIQIPINFLNPYGAKSIREFWRKWHISLMNWLRDYIYIPLGGSKKNRYINLLTVFFISGLWHGAQWHFIFWGLYNAALYILQITFKPARLLSWLPSSIKRIILTIITFHLIALGWILFRSKSLSSVLIPLSNVMNYPKTNLVLDKQLPFYLFLLMFYIFGILILKLVRKNHRLYTCIRVTLYALGAFGVAAYLDVMKTAFIYYQF